MKHTKIINAMFAAMALVLLSSCGNIHTYDEDLKPYVEDYEPYVTIYEAEERGEDEGAQEETGPWHPANFVDVRQPLYLSDATPHGYISVRHIEFMNDNLYGRSPFTYREKEAAAWIVEELLAMGYDWEDIHVQEFNWNQVSGLATNWGFTWYDRVEAPRMLGDGQLREGRLSQNVILTVPGQTEQKIIVGAHYDTLPYPGASDNASGVALLLESAQRMLNEDNYHTIVYVFFGAEEIALLGADFYLRTIPRTQQNNIVMMVNADVLFEGPYFVYGAGYVPAERWWDAGLVPRTNNVTEQVSRIAQNLYASHGLDIISYPNNIFRGSDHLPFAWAGHTVVYLAGYDQDDEGNFILRVLHSPQDCFHYINENWPGKIDEAMHTFSIFLEEILLSQF